MVFGINILKLIPTNKYENKRYLSIVSSEVFYHNYKSFNTNIKFVAFLFQFSLGLFFLFYNYYVRFFSYWRPHISIRSHSIFFHNLLIRVCITDLPEKLPVNSWILLYSTENRNGYRMCNQQVANFWEEEDGWNYTRNIYTLYFSETCTAEAVDTKNICFK